MVKLAGGGWIQGWEACGGYTTVDCQTCIVLYNLGKALAAYQRSMIVFRKNYRKLPLGWRYAQLLATTWQHSFQCHA